jgi:DNA-binding NarL/FixJ family response regulator
MSLKGVQRRPGAGDHGQQCNVERPADLAQRLPARLVAPAVTVRQRKVLGLMRKGIVNKQIGREPQVTKSSASRRSLTTGRRPLSGYL